VELVVAEEAARPRAVRWFEAFAGMLASPRARRVTRTIARLALALRALVPGKLVERAVLAFVKMEAECCTQSSPYYKFLQRYVAQFEKSGTFARARAFLRERSPKSAAARLDAWVRIGAITALRHEVLAKYKGQRGVAPRLLTEAQLALSPRCDLECEGCYTREDRGGSAPRRERIAYLVDELVSCGVFTIHIIGKGEPFLSPTWARELLSVIEERPHVFFTIATHGMHVDDELAARLGSLGNVIVLVSIDGNEATHDARRGAGSYQRVARALERLRAHGALFGFSCMVSKKNHEDLVSEAFLEARRAQGCAVGVYSRYFPLSSEGEGVVDELTLDPETLATYTARFDAVRAGEGLPLLDLDEVEQHTGCHSRAGESIYVDGITGQIAPCLRVPFAPDECSLDAHNAKGQLAARLSHPFFNAYRTGEKSCPTWCGANLSGELGAVSALLDSHCASDRERLSEYEQRARDASAPKRRLPVLNSPSPQPARSPSAQRTASKVSRSTP
jgi:uncharacterized Fe-S cluster-containing radical SAM superfamily protein